MCGIAGLVDLVGQPSGDELAGMIDALSHRGPNGRKVANLGPAVLGHQRLSILDPTPAGDQPMTSADGRYTAVHNGEIYNFLELADDLRARGHKFRTRSDTEVLLAAFAEWGPLAVERFNGIWALAIWDSREQQLFLSRDRFGVKPLFIARAGTRLAFASEIKALLTLPWVRRRPNAAAVREFLIDARVDHGRETFFEGIERLPGGHNLFLDASGQKEDPFWAPPTLASDTNRTGALSDLELVRRVREAVIDSVSLQIRSDVPIGSCLSGGLDSSIIVSVASALRSGRIASTTVAHHDRDQAAQLAFFADFPDPGISERRYVDAIVDATGVDLRTVTPSSGAALASLEAVVRAQDEPFGSTSIVAQYHVMKLAHEARVPVLLDGQGADEIFGGYLAYRAHRDAGLALTTHAPGMLARSIRGAGLGSLGRVAWSLATSGGPPPSSARPSRRLRGLLGQSVAAAARVRPVWGNREGTNLARALWRDLAWGHLPGLLRYEDRNSMAFGIESRVPFLDHRLVELALTIPDRLKIEDGFQKVALRRAFKDLVPDAVLGRKDKIGFASPEDSWLSAWMPGLRPLTEDARSERSGLLTEGSLATVLGWWSAGDVPRDVVWRVLSLEMWARVCLGGESLPIDTSA